MNNHEHHEEIIRGLSDQLQDILQSSDQAIYLYLDDIHKACNQNFADLLGYSSPAEWVAITKPFPQAFVAEASQTALVDAYGAAIQQKIGSTLPVTWKKKDGGAVETTVMLVPLSFQGHIFAVHFIDKGGD